MKRIRAVIGVGVGIALAFVVGIFAVSELGGELITLETRDETGALHETRLWIVDKGDTAWLRSGMPDSGWLNRIDADPEVFVTRNGERRLYVAIPMRDPVTRDEIHVLMARKYGWAEQIISQSRDGSKSVAVQLRPVEDDRS